MPVRPPLILLALLPMAALACGSAERASVTATDLAPARAAGAPRYLGAAELQRQLGNGLRAGLADLARLQRPPDDAVVAAGQSIPTGLLDEVRCRPQGPRPDPAAASWPWRCDVRWETASGRPRTLRYAVANRATACFAASARPVRPPRPDPVLRTIAEDPLNTITSGRRGC